MTKPQRIVIVLIVECCFYAGFGFLALAMEQQFTAGVMSGFFVARLLVNIEALYDAAYMEDDAK